jgi:aryl-alcohol dehydrogenase-like predicted oxidoreductase
MHYRSFGRSEALVSEIGFGTWGIGGTHQGAVAYGPTDDRESLAALETAFERGVTFYDTADLYGYGHSERLLGQALGGVRPKIFIATKAGFLDADGRQDFSSAHLQRSLTASLERLGTDYVDLFQLHSPGLAILQEGPDIIGWLHSIRRSGVARCVGISARSPEEALVIASEFEIDALQVNFNLTDQRALQNGLLDLCANRGIAVIVRTPLCFGFLTGAFAGQQEFDASDHRSRWSSAQRRRWSEAQEVFQQCLQSEENQTPAQVALRFCLSYRGVSTIIPGMLTPAHVIENIRASELGPLTEAELRRIEGIYDSELFFVGR